MHSTLKIIGWLVALLVLLAGISAAYYFFSRQPARDSQALSSLIAAKRSGDDATALTHYQQIQSDASVSSEEKARAFLLVAGTEFSLSESTDAIIRDVQQLKTITQDTSLSTQTRAAAMSALGNEYFYSGGNPAVFQEIYKDAPFNSYLVPNEPALSAINLEKLAYSMQPVPYSAIRVSEFALGMYFDHPGQSASTTASHVALAEDYLKKADAAAAQAAASSRYSESSEYLMYKFSRAHVIAQLAVEKGDPYSSLYHAEYENFIQYAQSLKSTTAAFYAMYARFGYAKFLAREKDTATEKAQLDLLASEMGQQNPSAGLLIMNFKNAYTTQPKGSTWVSIQQMSKVSPSFKTAIDKLVVNS